MNRIECTARLIAAENGESPDDWQKYEIRAISALRNLPFTRAEMEKEVSPSHYERGLKLLQTPNGRYEMKAIAASVRDDLQQKQ